MFLRSKLHNICSSVNIFGEYLGDRISSRTSAADCTDKRAPERVENASNRDPGTDQYAGRLPSIVIHSVSGVIRARARANALLRAKEWLLRWLPNC
jgi:hypothetical protein